MPLAKLHAYPFNAAGPFKVNRPFTCSSLELVPGHKFDQTALGLSDRKVKSLFDSRKITMASPGEELVDPGKPPEEEPVPIPEGTTVEPLTGGWYVVHTEGREDKKLQGKERVREHLIELNKELAGGKDGGDF